MKIRLLYIADSTSVHTQRWLKYFADRKYEIYLITIGKKRKILPYVHHVANFEKFYYDSPAFAATLFKTRRLIRSIAPDILHAHFVHQYGWLGALSGYHPFILTPWGTDIFQLPYKSRAKIGKLLTQYTLAKADGITVISNYLKEESIKLGANPDKIDVFFLGVDTVKFHPEVETKTIKKELKIPDNVPVIFSNRTFTRLYNNDVIIEAMAIVLKHFPNTILMLQNAGGVISGENRLRQLALEKGIETSVRFLPQYHHDDLPSLYALADIYVSVPSWDAGPLSLQEAMASHCAPIISEVSGPMEWVRQEENGLVVPVRDVDKLTKSILDLLANKEKRLRFNQINRRLILDRAQHTAQMRKVDEIYQRIINVF